MPGGFSGKAFFERKESSDNLVLGTQSRTNHEERWRGTTLSDASPGSEFKVLGRETNPAKCESWGCAPPSSSKKALFRQPNLETSLNPQTNSSWACQTRTRAAKRPAMKFDTS